MNLLQKNVRRSFYRGSFDTKVHLRRFGKELRQMSNAPPDVSAI
jgi:hypothetical protein